MHTFRRAALSLLLLAVAWPLPARAQWRVTGRAPLPAAPRLQFSIVQVESGSQRVELHLVAFLATDFRVELLDNPGKARSLGETALARHAVAAVNGGYFGTDDAPLGLRVSGGQVLHPQERAKLLSGIGFTAGGRFLLQRTAEFALRPTVREAVQAGPFLVDGARPVPGLNATRAAARTVLLAGPEQHAALILSQRVTLAQLGEILATPGLLPETGRIVRALNLDGGSSSGLWVAAPEGGRPFYAREFKSVRDFVGLVPVR